MAAHTPAAAGRAFAERLTAELIAGYTIELRDSPVDATIEQLLDTYCALTPAERKAFAVPID